MSSNSAPWHLLYFQEFASCNFFNLLTFSDCQLRVRSFPLPSSWKSYVRFPSGGRRKLKCRNEKFKRKSIFAFFKRSLTTSRAKFSEFQLCSFFPSVWAFEVPSELLNVRFWSFRLEKSSQTTVVSCSRQTTWCTYLCTVDDDQKKNAIVSWTSSCIKDSGKAALALHSHPYFRMSV